MITDPPEMFRVLSAEARIMILKLLKNKGPLCTFEIAAFMKVSSSAVSQHLKLLRIAGLVLKKRIGFRVPYTLNDSALVDYHSIINQVCSLSAAETFTVFSEPNNFTPVDKLKLYEKTLTNGIANIRAKITKLNKS